ncbi:DUF2867 domain-containing protein [Vibrio sinaloensis]|uniref:DUF2867 domain-containing protein n=1 Tax=Photobacterium sp. (strain ATCC 43367) TaxID=379097 RepID=UPI00057CBBE1|nr:DUF2867 domain-containing protein [Vibrio sinaloensis]KHT49458.1 hypothetical protein RJ46_07825 [Vibrio sinaloensis]
MSCIVSGDIPSKSRLFARRKKHGFSDSLSFTLIDQDRSPAEVYIDIFGRLPQFVETLMALRNRLVKPLGFAVSPRSEALTVEMLEQQCTNGLHRVEWLSEEEVICTSEDKHMQVSLSLLKTDAGHFTLSTLVNTNSLVGRVYLMAIIPFHKVIALASVRGALSRLESID